MSADTVLLNSQSGTTGNALHCATCVLGLHLYQEMLLHYELSETLNAGPHELPVTRLSRVVLVLPELQAPSTTD